MLTNSFKKLGILMVLITLIHCNNTTSKEKENPLQLPLLLGLLTYNSTSGFSKYALDSIDLSRYAGTWYEIERIPNSFQGSLSSVRATYSAREDGNITVYNEGVFPSGGKSNITGVAIPTSLPKAILKVSFFYPVIFSDYYVIGLDTTNYSHAMIGGPVPEILWILSRESTLSESIVNSYKDTARTMGYSVDLLKKY